MVNWTHLQNLPQPNINTTSLQEVETIIPVILDAADTTTQGYLGFGVMLVIFLGMAFTIFRDDGDIRLDLLRTIMISSGLTSIVGTIFLVLGVFSSFVHLMWFITIFILSVIGVYLTKKREG